MKSLRMEAVKTYWGPMLLSAVSFSIGLPLWLKVIIGFMTVGATAFSFLNGMMTFYEKTNKWHAVNYIKNIYHVHFKKPPTKDDVEKTD